MELRFTILLFELGFAVVVQIAILAAILAAVKRSGQRMESMASQLEQRAIPALDSAKAILEHAQPQLETILGNLASTSAMLQQQMGRLDATASDVLDRARLQVIRADEMVTRTMDRLEETTEIVSHNVISPVRHVAGFVSGISAGFVALFGRRGRGRDMQQDEMFI